MDIHEVEAPYLLPCSIHRQLTEHQLPSSTGLVEKTARRHRFHHAEQQPTTDAKQQVARHGAGKHGNADARFLG